MRTLFLVALIFFAQIAIASDQKLLCENGNCTPDPIQMDVGDLFYAPGDDLGGCLITSVNRVSGVWTTECRYVNGSTGIVREDCDYKTIKTWGRAELSKVIQLKAGPKVGRSTLIPGDSVLVPKNLYSGCKTSQDSYEGNDIVITYSSLYKIQKVVSVFEFTTKHLGQDVLGQIHITDEGKWYRFSLKLTNDFISDAVPGQTMAVSVNKNGHSICDRLKSDSPGLKGPLTSAEAIDECRRQVIVGAYLGTFEAQGYNVWGAENPPPTYDFILVKTAEGIVVLNSDKGSIKAKSAFNSRSLLPLIKPSWNGVNQIQLGDDLAHIKYWQVLVDDSYIDPNDSFFKKFPYMRGEIATTSKVKSILATANNQAAYCEDAAGGWSECQTNDQKKFIVGSSSSAALGLKIGDSPQVKLNLLASCEYDEYCFDGAITKIFETGEANSALVVDSKDKTFLLTNTCEYQKTSPGDLVALAINHTTDWDEKYFTHEVSYYSLLQIYLNKTWWNKNNWNPDYLTKLVLNPNAHSFAKLSCGPRKADIPEKPTPSVAHQNRHTK